MPLGRTKDGIVIDIPEGMDPLDPHLQAQVQKAREQRQAQVEAYHNSPGWQDKVKQQQQDDAKTYSPTAGMSGTEKVFANLGAGTSNLWTGAKQFVGLADPEEIAEKRARDEALAKSITGGGALQIAGEVAPTLAIPGGAIARGAGAIPKLGGLLTRAMGTGVRQAATEGALVGGGLGALQPTLPKESTTANAILGAVGGAVLPAAVSAARKGARYFTQAGAQSRAADKLVEGVGGPQAAAAAAAAARAQQAAAAQPGAVTARVPYRFSQAAQSPEAARLELAQRGTDPDLWVAFEQQQNQQLFDAAQHATRSAPEVAAREAARDSVTAPLRETALREAAGSDPTGPLRGEIDRLLTHPPSSPEHRVALGMQRDLQAAEQAGGITPEYLYRMRKNLMHQYETRFPADADTAAVRGAGRESLALRDAMDTGLDQASSGWWRTYLGEYAQHARGVDSAQAQAAVRAAIAPIGGPTVGQSPQVTRTILKRALGAGGERMEELSPAAQQRMQEVIDAATRIEEPMRTLKLAGTGGGGSQTAMQQAAMKTMRGAADVLPWGGSVVDAAQRRSATAMDRELTTLLLSPERAAAAIERKLAAGQTLSGAEKALAVSMRSLGAGAGLGLQPKSQ